jgi:hypothetical protein
MPASRILTALAVTVFALFTLAFMILGGVVLADLAGVVVG